MFMFPEFINRPFNIAIRLPSLAIDQEIKHMRKFMCVAAQELGYRLSHVIVARKSKRDIHVEPAPKSRIDKFRMVSCSNEQPSMRPILYFLEQYIDQAFKLTNIRLVTSFLRNRIYFVKKKDARMTSGEI